MGEKKIDDATLAVTDLFRLSVLTMLAIPVIFYFIARPMLIFMGCTSDIADDGRAYLVPILIAMPLITTFQLSCGFLQSEGRSFLCGAMQLLAFALNCGFFSPILLLVLKIPLRLAGLSFALSQSIIGIILTLLIYSGRFGLKPSLRSCIGPFHRPAFHGMLIALPFLINVLAAALPGMLLLTLIMKAASSQGISDKIGVIFPVFIKLNSAINSVSIGLCQGFLGAGSYACGARQPRRHLQLLGTVCLLGFAYHLVLMPIMVFKTEWLLSIWLKDDLDIAKRLVRIPYFTNTLIPLNFALINFLLSMKKAVVSLILTVVRGGLYVAYSFLCYHAMGQDPFKMMYAYNMDDATLFILGILCVAAPFMHVLTEARGKVFATMSTGLMSVDSSQN
jgi:Na+-driven multidrug efflux pump